MFGQGKVLIVGYEEQPIRELVASIAAEYGARSYSCIPTESSTETFSLLCTLLLESSHGTIVPRKKEELGGIRRKFEAL